ncbi:RDD family protein [Streptomyces fractus]|uniref:RDD family protein n=1 Tax=Streptomyces fractus TaxID=641806 RepID=UPI003CEF8CB9
MSAPTPAPGDDRPREGYYPDPSIPGYVRYWNGAAWVPGTSRPAPSDGESLPAPPGAGAVPAPTSASEPPPAEETGPVFLDEEPSVHTEMGPSDQLAHGGPAHGGPAHGAPAYGRPVSPSPEPEPASAWQANTSRQAGFGAEQAHRVSWGSDPNAETPEQSAPEASAPPERTDGTVKLRAMQQPCAGRPAPADGTMAFRALPKQDGQAGQTGQAGQAAQAGLAGTTTPGQSQAQARAGLNPQPTPQSPAAPAQPNVPQQQPQQHQPQQPQQHQPPQAQAHLQSPMTQGPGGGAPSWPQQVHQLAGQGQVQGQAPAPAADPNAPVAPFKPVASDPFLAAAQAAAAARPAGLGKRFAARLIDSVVVGAVTATVAVPLGTKAADHINGKIDEAKASGHQVTVWLLDGTTGTYLGIVLAVLLVAGTLYEALPTSKWGHTLGKKLLGLTVRDIEEHESPTFVSALKRWLAYSVPGVLVVGVLGVLWGAFDRPWRQCLHDKVARTFVAAD